MPTAPSLHTKRVCVVGHFSAAALTFDVYAHFKARCDTGFKWSRERALRSFLDTAHHNSSPTRPSARHWLVATRAASADAVEQSIVHFHTHTNRTNDSFSCGELHDIIDADVVFYVLRLASDTTKAATIEHASRHIVQLERAMAVEGRACELHVVAVTVSDGPHRVDVVQAAVAIDAAVGQPCKLRLATPPLACTNTAVATHVQQDKDELRALVERAATTELPQPARDRDAHHAQSPLCFRILALFRKKSVLTVAVTTGQLRVGMRIGVPRLNCNLTVDGMRALDGTELGSAGPNSIVTIRTSGTTLTRNHFIKYRAQLHDGRSPWGTSGGAVLSVDNSRFWPRLPLAALLRDLSGGASSWAAVRHSLVGSAGRVGSCATRSSYKGVVAVFEFGAGASLSAARPHAVAREHRVVVQRSDSVCLCAVDEVLDRFAAHDALLQRCLRAGPIEHTVRVWDADASAEASRADGSSLRLVTALHLLAALQHGADGTGLRSSEGGGAEQHGPSLGVAPTALCAALLERNKPFGAAAHLVGDHMRGWTLATLCVELTQHLGHPTESQRRAVSVSASAPPHGYHVQQWPPGSPFALAAERVFSLPNVARSELWCDAAWLRYDTRRQLLAVGAPHRRSRRHLPLLTREEVCRGRTRSHLLMRKSGMQQVEFAAGCFKRGALSFSLLAMITRVAPSLAGQALSVIVPFVANVGLSNVETALLLPALPGTVPGLNVRASAGRGKAESKPERMQLPHRQRVIVSAARCFGSADLTALDAALRSTRSVRCLWRQAVAVPERTSVAATAAAQRGTDGAPDACPRVLYRFFAALVGYFVAVDGRCDAFSDMAVWLAHLAAAMELPLLAIPLQSLCWARRHARGSATELVNQATYPLNAARTGWLASTGGGVLWPRWYITQIALEGRFTNKTLLKGNVALQPCNDQLAALRRAFWLALFRQVRSPAARLCAPEWERVVRFLDGDSSGAWCDDALSSYTGFFARHGLETAVLGMEFGAS